LIDIFWSSENSAREVRTFLQWELIKDSSGDTVDQTAETLGRHKKFNEDYFLTSPEEFVFSHLPERQEWQLLARPVTTDEFEKMAYLLPAFFRFGWQLDSHKTCVVRGEKGEATISFIQPDGANYDYEYRLWLQKNDEIMSAYFNNVALKRYVLLQSVDNALQCKINFPSPAKFKLQLYCLDTKKSERIHDLACELLLTSDRPKPGVRPYPEKRRNEWGPGYALEAAGLQPVNHKNGVVICDNGDLEMTFLTLKSVKFAPIVHSNKLKREEMDKYICYQISPAKLRYS
jgi:hypothetical protein